MGCLNADMEGSDVCVRHLGQIWADEGLVSKISEKVAYDDSADIHGSTSYSPKVSYGIILILRDQSVSLNRKPKEDDRTEFAQRAH